MQELPSLYARHLQARVAEALTDTPVVLLTGPRQAGKTTLVRQLAKSDMRYITLDDELSRLSAQEDPVGLIRSLNCAVIDEIQRAPQLLLAIKKSVDEDRRPGRFLLTGSANLLFLPNVADSLAGRMETLTLLPLSQTELHGTSVHWIDAIFAGHPPQITQSLSADTLMDTVIKGGYPEMVARTTPRRRNTWAQQYIDALLTRDVRDLAAVDKLDQLPRFLQALAQMSGQLCNYTQLGGQIGLDSKTAARYVGIFEQMYLLRRMPVWAGNRLKRVVKAHKLQFLDSGLLASLTNSTIDLCTRERTRFGHLLESFVYAELLKHSFASDNLYHLCYYRDHDQLEVDIVIENSAGQLVGIEVKASATIRESDLKGLNRLRTVAGEAFKLGVVLYDGTETMPIGNRLWAVPVSTLWSASTK